MKLIKDCVLRNESIDWKKLKPFQPDNLKSMTSLSFEKLKNSIKQENFVASFKVWHDKDNYWILDGHHRLYALQALEEEGYEIAEKFHCEIIDCQSKKQAARLIIRYSSNHARMDALGLSEMMHVNELDILELKDSVEIPGIDLEKLFLENVDIDFEEKPINDKNHDERVICPQCDHSFIP